MKTKKYITAATGMLAFVGLNQEAQALPMFSTQTGMDCKSCHLQHIPKLNEFGRKFAASGMTLSKKILDENMTAADINPSVMVKSLYQKTWDKPGASGDVSTKSQTEDGEFSIPKTATLYLGGRVSENIGGLVNLSYKKEEDEAISAKAVYTQKIEDGFWGIAGSSFADFGPFSGMEFYNTGLYKPLRTFDIRTLSNAFQASSIGTGESTGLQAYYDKGNLFGTGDHFFVTAGAYAPSQDNLYMDIADNILPFARVAYAYPIGDFNVMAGAFAIAGGSTVASTEPLSIERETYGIDMQIEGEIAEKLVSLNVAKILKNEVTYTGIDAGAVHELDNLDNEAFSIEGEVNLTPDFGVKVAYMEYNDRYTYPDHDHGGGDEHEGEDHDHESTNDFVDVRDLDHAITVGFDYSFEFHLPMKVTAEYCWAKPSLDRVKEYETLLFSLNMLF